MEHKLIQTRNSPRLVTAQYIIGIYHQSRPEIFRSWYKTMIFSYHDGRLWFFVPKNEFDKLIAAAARILETGDKRFIRWYSWYRDRYFPQKALDLARKVRAMNLRQLRDKALLLLLRKSFYIFLEDVYPIHQVPFEYGFANYLRKRLNQQISDPLEIDSYLSRLAIAEKPSEVMLEEKEFLKLVLRTRKKRISSHKKQVLDLLEKHYQKYRFRAVAHGNEPAKKSYFLKRWQDLSRKPFADLQKRIRNVDVHEQHVAKERKMIYDRLHTDQKFKIASYLFSGLGHIRDRNKAVLGEMLYSFNLILREISRRYHLRDDEFAYYFLEELFELISTGSRLTKGEISKRKQSLVIVYQHGPKKKLASRRKVYSGAEAESFIQKTIQQQISFKGVLKGVIASLGKAKGRVRIVLGGHDVPKVQEGDIMIAPGTDYEMVPAMKKARAIVTDEGGLLSHAAIVSREFKKPCVIATKIATKVLKDGDLVEVDANKGIVRVLKR